VEVERAAAEVADFGLKIHKVLGLDISVAKQNSNSEFKHLLPQQRPFCPQLELQLIKLA
jgi:hypothetical protein